MSNRRQNLAQCRKTTTTNVGLWLDKYFGQENEHENLGEEKLKQKLVKEVTGIETPEIYRQCFWRWKQSLDDLRAQMRTIKISGRVIIGLGAEGVLETSVKLHRTYGVPVISGSSLKGLAAAYACRKLNSELWNREKKDGAYQTVFGSQDFAGFVTFHDALPVPDNKLPLAPDVLTVHHRDYYGDKSNSPPPPADWDNPVPIPLLSATGDYLLALSSVPGTEKWIERTFEILALALAENGVGAKTSSGYGRAVLSEQIPETDAEKVARSEKEKAASAEKARQAAIAAEEQKRIEEIGRAENQLARYQKWMTDMKTATDKPELDPGECRKLEKSLRDFLPEQRKQGAKEFFACIGAERGAKLVANNSGWYEKIKVAAEGA